MENFAMILSFIIPVYNVEKYVAKCLDSILVGNAFTGQVICVNDGSTDGSGKILEQYATKYPNVEIITQPNAGLSAARNSGIKAATGEYVCFLDSDDYWEPNVLGELMEQIDRDNLDVLRFKFQNVRILTDNDEISHDKSLNDPLTLNDVKYEVFLPYKRDLRLENDYSESVTDGVTFLNERMNTQCYAVMFIVKRSLLYNDEMCRDKSLNDPLALNDACLFTEGIYFEDTDWTPRMLVRAKRIASTETMVYNYLVREGSITNAINRSKQKKVLDDKMRLVEAMQKQSKELLEQGKDNRWFARMIADVVISVIGIIGKDFYEERKDYLWQLNDLHIYPLQSNHKKAKLINLSPQLAIALLHFKNGE